MTIKPKFKLPKRVGTKEQIQEDTEIQQISLTEFKQDRNYNFGMKYEGLDYNLLRNKPDLGGGVYTYKLSQLISGTSIITINPGFEPSSVEVFLYGQGTGAPSSHYIYSNGTTVGSLDYYTFNGTYDSYDRTSSTGTDLVGRLFQRTTGNDISARIENITSVSFDINFYRVFYTDTITLIIKCYP